MQAHAIILAASLFLCGCIALVAMLFSVVTWLLLQCNILVVRPRASAYISGNALQPVLQLLYCI